MSETGKPRVSSGRIWFDVLLMRMSTATRKSGQLLVQKKLMICFAVESVYDFICTEMGSMDSVPNTRQLLFYSQLSLAAEKIYI